MKAAVVTGASSGLGAEFARQISAKYGKLDEIWIIARREERLARLGEELKIPTRIFVMDLTDSRDTEAFKEQLSELAPDIKLLVNCAGFGRIGRFDELDLDDQCGMIDLNCKALTLFTGICLPYISNHSRIINVASAAAFSPQPGFNVYAATKAYVLSYSRALHAELKDRRITVTAVCPGPVDTEFFDVAGDASGQSFKKNLRANPQKVVALAIRDAALGNDISVYGMAMKSARVASKVVPNGLIMNFFKKG
ncbi:MAG: SDR family NAD(P)-dependent oxidoreductase [Butyrivibrio sp.]|nr:SDR family NAD(P)-dependent oxidoreductase [Butyrivibrio sp.]